MSKLFVILGFLVAFVAGVTVGWRVSPPAVVADVLSTDTGASTKPTATAPADGTRKGPREGGDRRDPGGWLTEALKLSSGQQEQMKQIWSATAHEGRREREERRAALRKDRDELIAKLMVESGKKDEFDWIYATYARKVEDLDNEWRGKFQSAVEQTKAILSPEQRQKYDEILNRHAPNPQQPPQQQPTATQPNGGERGEHGGGPGGKRGRDQ